VLTSDPCQPGTICDYRAPGAYPTCFDRIECQVDTTWHQTRTSQNCGKPTNDPACPATIDGLAAGTDCGGSGRTCYYDEGWCGCNACSIGGMLPVNGDWECSRWGAGAAGCPADPPLAGTNCTTPDLGCGYDGLGLGDGVSCIDGVWKVLPSPEGLFLPASCPQTLTCGFTTAPAAPAPAAAGATAEQGATAAALARYDALIGRFLRGDVTVYSGDFGAFASELNPASPNPTLNEFQAGAALALLDIRPTVLADWSPTLASPAVGSMTAVLVAHSMATPLYAVVAQRSDDTPGTTWLSGVRSDSPTAPQANQLVGSCMSCVPALSPAPEEILIDQARAVRTVTASSDGGSVQVQLNDVVQGQLARVRPCSLRWKQLVTLDTTTGPNEVALDPGLGGFVDSGDEMVEHITSYFLDQVITNGTCGLMTGYTIDLWVKKADLGAHGVRNFTATSTQMVCGA
jgi:hypothetical protein